MRELTSADFQSFINNDAVVIAFSASWCGPCRMLYPTLEKLANQGFNVAKVDIDESSDLADRFNVAAVPTVMIFKSGKMVHSHVGLLNEDKLKELLK